MIIAWLWLRAYRWPALLAVCCGVVAVGVLVGNEHVPVPSLISIRRLSVPVVQLLPLVLACAAGLHSKTPSTLFTVVPRSHPLLRAALAACLLATVSTACLAVPDTLSALRNTLGLTGLAFGTAVVGGATRSWTLPLFYLMGCLLFGTRAHVNAAGEAGPHWWAFALAQAHDHVAMLLALLCCAVGTLLIIVWGPKPENGSPH